jgi:hypothetical protein
VAEDFQGQDDEVVFAGVDGAEVEAFDDGDAAAEQDDVGAEGGGAELLDGEVVDADKFDSVVGEELGGIGREECEIAMEVRVNHPGIDAVAGAEEDAFGAAPGVAIELVGGDGDDLGINVDDEGGTHEGGERDLVYGGASADEVHGRIDVGAGVGADGVSGEVERVAAIHVIDEVELDGGVAFVNRRDGGVKRGGDVDPGGGGVGDVGVGGVVGAHGGESGLGGRGLRGLLGGDWLRGGGGLRLRLILRRDGGGFGARSAG